MSLLYINFGTNHDIEVKLIETDLDIEHLLRLLDDESAEIQKILRQTILKNSLEFIFEKENIQEKLDENYSLLLNNVFKDLHFDLTFAAFQQLISGNLEDIELEKAVLLLSYWNNPNVKLPEIENQLDQISQDIQQSMPTTGHPLSFIDHVSEYFSKELCFHGNTTDYYNPDNSFIDQVLITRTGIPISLSVIFILIANRLGLPILGVPMPAHFIIKFDDGVDEIFFDPFYDSKIYSHEECFKYLEKAKIKNPEEILDGCMNFQIILRMMRNIQLVYSSYKNEPQKVNEIEQLLNLVEQHYQ